MVLDVRRMQILRAVIASGSITAAAKNLGYTPSALSQQLSTLEREAGVGLLERIGRGVRPTPAGSLLAEHAEVLSTQLAEAEAALAELREGRTGRLAIRYFATAGTALMPGAVATVRREYPGLRLDLRLAEPDESLPEVVAGRADVAIVVLPPDRPRAGLPHTEHLLDDPYHLVLPHGHRLCGERVVDLAELAEENWVGSEWPQGSCWQIVLNACAAAGFAPNVTVQAEDYQTAQGFVAAGLGITLIPRLGLGTPHPDVLVRPVHRPRVYRSVHAAITPRARDQPVVARLIEVMRALAPAPDRAKN